MAMYEQEILRELSAGLIGTIPSFAIGVATYVLTAVALYTIAKRRGLRRPWLAWIPVASVWLLGSLADQYRYVVRGENRSRRKVLLTLSIINMALCIVMIVLAASMVVQLLGVMDLAYFDEHMMLETILGPVMGIMGVFLPMMGISIAYTVIYFLALYDVYKSLDPNNCVVYLVLSIVFGVTTPFFLFFNRKKDYGMPPRRPQPGYNPLQPGYVPPQQPWDGGVNPENKDYL